MNIIYMGTPEFAVKPLQAIVDAGHKVLACFTQPDKPKGRGKTLRKRHFPLIYQFISR
jgi:methionyl-tRNA formyltransferase